jgi:large conductance mechanosensitive channel
VKGDESIRGFINFVREQGVVGLAVGFILGGAISKVVASLVADLINPLLSIILGAAGNLKDMFLKIGPIKILWGDFVSNVIDFLVISFVVYFGLKLMKLEKIDKNKSA